MESTTTSDYLSTYTTTYDLSKIPKKKMSYKQQLYKQRLRYGAFVKMGWVNDKLKISFQNGKVVYQMDNTYNHREEEKLWQDPFYKSLFYCSDWDFSENLSKREIKLRKALNVKMNRLREIMTINNTTNTLKPEDNNQ